MIKTIKAAVLLLVALVLLSACSQAATEPDEYGLHYKGGTFTATKFANCVEPSARNIDGPGDKHFYYPAGQRTYKFTDAKGADTGPIKVATKDNIELATEGVVTFTLDGGCDALRKFHESIGLKDWGGKPAYIDGSGDDAFTGWRNMLDIYIGQPLQRAINDASQGLGWKALYNDPATKTEWERSVLRLLPTYIKQAAGADYFKVSSVTIQKPTPPANIIAALAASEQARLENAAQAQKNEKTVTELQGIKRQISVMGRETWLQKYAIDSGKVDVLPVPAGTGVVVNGGGR